MIPTALIRLDASRTVFSFNHPVAEEFH